MYARIAVARPLQHALTYAIPAHLEDRLTVGHVVLVPFGRSGAETGYVIELLQEPDLDPARIRPITRLLDAVCVFDASQLGFFRWIADYYMAPLGMVIHTAVPSQMKARVVRVLEPTEDGIDALTQKEATAEMGIVLREIVARPGLTKRGLSRRLAGEVDAQLMQRVSERLVRKGWAAWSERELSETKARIKTVALAVPQAEVSERIPRAGKRMLALVDMLVCSSQALDVVEVVAAQGASARDALRRLESAGVVVFADREDRDVLDAAKPLGPTEPLNHNVDQLRALKTLGQPDANGTFLLFGVTGSGKTEVFLGVASEVLARGKQVLVLVPEIGLTPQLVGRFCARLGDVAVLHSGLTGAQRLRHWRRIRAGEVSIAIGARSALFAPFHNLGLIVVDEEHDDSYKQDDGVCYNARDLAVVLGRTQGCPVVLASATPSLESWKNAEDGRYNLLCLPERATPRPVPRVELVDLSSLEVPEGEKRPLFAPQVESALRETFEAGQQAIVLYNRRGYATMVQCSSCGGTYECPNCGITMTLHRSARVTACHYCGLRTTYDGMCPVCKTATIEEMGKGTERICEELARLFPQVPQARMDADTTAVRGSHERILSAFRKGETQLLVGTQIVAKGHDFPGVQTAVVVSADHGFRLPDFRAAERTCSLLIQLAGRAGRGDKPGRVFVQTYKPDHYVLGHLDDLEGFFKMECRLRATLRYPPFTRLCLVRMDGVKRQEVLRAARDLAEKLREKAHEHGRVDVLGPSPAALPKLVGRWRFQIILRGDRTKHFSSYLREVRSKLQGAAKKGVRVHTDVDPRHLM